MNNIPSVFSKNQLSNPVRLTFVEIEGGWIVVGNSQDGQKHKILPLGTSTPYPTLTFATSAASSLVELDENFTLT